MQSLINLIRERAKTLSIQETASKKNPPEEKEWSECKAYVRGMNRKFLDVFMEANRNTPEIIQYHYGKKKNMIYIPQGECNGFRIELVLIETVGGGVESAYYVAFNNAKNLAYKEQVL